MMARPGESTARVVLQASTVVIEYGRRTEARHVLRRAAAMKPHSN
jgi:hypothetical protein